MTETAARIGAFLGLFRARYRIIGPVRLTYGREWNGSEFKDDHVVVKLKDARPGFTDNLVALLACEISRSKNDASPD